MLKRNSFYKLIIGRPILACALILSVCANTVLAQTNTKPAALSVAASSTDAKANTDEWVVVLKDPRPARLRGFQVKGYSKHYSNSLELKRFGKRVAKDHKLGLKQAWFIDSLGVYCLIVRFKQDQGLTLNQLKEDQRVDWVQPSNEFELLKSNEASRIEAVPAATTQPDKLNILDGNGVRIALIDSGVSTTHPDLSNAISVSQDLVVGGAPLSSAGEKHGTAMAGIWVARPNKASDLGLGLSGLAPAAQVLAFRGCWESTEGDTQCNTLSLARALDSAFRAKPSILNLSLSGPRDRLLDRLIDKLVMQGVFIVAAFDPKRDQSERFPSRGNGVLIVRAEHLQQDHANEFTAPGKRLVLSPDANYQSMSGHSVATAYTTGILALMAQASLSKTNTKPQHSNFQLTSLVDANGTPTITNASQLLRMKNDLASRL